MINSNKIIKKTYVEKPDCIVDNVVELVEVDASVVKSKNSATTKLSSKMKENFIPDFP